MHVFLITVIIGENANFITHETVINKKNKIWPKLILIIINKYTNYEYLILIYRYIYILSHRTQKKNK